MTKELKQITTLVVLLLSVVFLTGESARPAHAYATRNVIVSLEVGANIEAKLGWYHVDLVRGDGSTVGYGLDVYNDGYLPNGTTRRLTFTFMHVPTSIYYIARISHSGHSTEYGSWFCPQWWYGWDYYQYEIFYW